MFSVGYNLVLRRLGGAYSQRWLAEVFEGVLLINPEPSDYLAAVELLERFADHPITLVDALAAVIAARTDARVWSFDRHFATMRVKVWRELQ